MSDYIPDPRLDPRVPNPNDPLNKKYDAYNYEPARGTGTYGIVAALVIAVLVVGFLFFGGPPRERTEMARAPDAAPATMERAPSLPMPAPAATPAPADQATTPATPAPLPNEPIRQ
jgi:hypothetical protein